MLPEVRDGAGITSDVRIELGDLGTHARHNAPATLRFFDFVDRCHVRSSIRLPLCQHRRRQDSVIGG